MTTRNLTKFLPVVAVLVTGAFITITNVRAALTSHVELQSFQARIDAVGHHHGAVTQIMKSANDARVQDAFERYFEPLYGSGKHIAELAEAPSDLFGMGLFAVVAAPMLALVYTSLRARRDGNNFLRHLAHSILRASFWGAACLSAASLAHVMWVKQLPVAVALTYMLPWLLAAFTNVCVYSLIGAAIFGAVQRRWLAHCLVSLALLTSWLAGPYYVVDGQSSALRWLVPRHYEVLALSGGTTTYAALALSLLVLLAVAMGLLRDRSRRCSPSL